MAVVVDVAVVVVLVLGIVAVEVDVIVVLVVVCVVVAVTAVVLVPLVAAVTCRLVELALDLGSKPRKSEAAVRRACSLGRAGSAYRPY